MRERHFIGQGDKTTCGGEVLEGDNRVNIFGVLHAREGDRVSCGKDGNIYNIIGGIPYINSHGRLVAGTLDSISGCPCRAQLIPSIYQATYESRSPVRDPAVMSKFKALNPDRGEVKAGSIVVLSDPHNFHALVKKAF
ncbi:PAAR domain-containing protein [Pseudomonas trivialis]|uniref:Zn-binding Pro-Ala-Ala-Arg (PAAR) domain-containing protein, incolved in TypeVI secretion n=1 Tax=Pseudomonas trivialis TaxID=200450 RepID=A0ABY0UGY6_9PSED|nr:Zn-binding Pro-Ala-Ala-Arg (PAAR) domain-containing protein, incolved in TypeVI secretion [Pseudomonas trivialis]